MIWVDLIFSPNKLKQPPLPIKWHNVKPTKIILHSIMSVHALNPEHPLFVFISLPPNLLQVTCFFGGERAN